MQQYIGTSDIILLTDLQQGQIMTIAMTGVTELWALEFQHCGSPTWHTYPALSVASGAGVDILEVRCISAQMRVKFASVPVTPYTLSVSWAAMSDW